MPKQITITVLINNTDVQGVLTIESTHKIRVEITKPYENVWNSKKLSFFSRLPDNANFSSAEIAVKQGKHLLKRLYEGLYRAQQANVSYDERLKVLDKECETILGLPDNTRAKLRCEFKQGNISQDDYQRHIAKLNDAKTQKELKTYALKKEFITDVFGDFFDGNGWRSFLLSLSSSPSPKE